MIPVWLHDGRTLLYLAGRPDFPYAWEIRRRGSSWSRRDHSVFTGMAVAPDDRTLFAVRKNDEGDIWMMTLAEGAGKGPRTGDPKPPVN